MSFYFHSITLHPLLVPYVEKMCVFESSGHLPALDKKLIVPNANIKLTLTCCNGIVACIDGKAFLQSENELTLTGFIDRPVILDSENDSQTGTIIIEFNPLGAYRLFHLSYAEVKNQIIEVSELFGYRLNELKSKLGATGNLTVKSRLLQNFLISQLKNTAPDHIYDYCIKRISDTNGQINVARLEKETGYSSRWLHKKFLEHLGTGPKNLSEILRFKQFYQAYSSGIKLHDLKGHIYQYYHDQSHFIRAFKRFTGSTPTDLQNSMNELATMHYVS